MAMRRAETAPAQIAASHPSLAVSDARHSGSRIGGFPDSAGSSDIARPREAAGSRPEPMERFMRGACARTDAERAMNLALLTPFAALAGLALVGVFLVWFHRDQRKDR
jgi:hypothetical protein